ncbi:MAG TPA: DUF1134 domain-containing protein [Methylocystis sp.]|nr:DUF1134 domain-containing protein [Methylocystis sp.]
MSDADPSFRLSRRSVLQIAASGLALSAPRALARDLPSNTPPPESYSNNEVIDSGHRFFGSISRGLGEGVETLTSRWGRPNAYILGQEAGGAFVGGLRYGEGEMFTRNQGRRRVYWQGPSLGFDAGGDGDRTMMLVYNLPSVEAIYQRFGGLDGSAYLVGGLGFTALNAGDVVLVPIRTGLGARLGLNLGYLKFTDRPTWNPF